MEGRSQQLLFQPPAADVQPKVVTHEPLLPKPKPLTEKSRLRMCVLGSGSGGNSTLIQAETNERSHNILIDAGFGPRTMANRLRQLKIHYSDLDAICLTHLDQDHFRPNLMRTLLQWQIPVYLHHWHLKDLRTIEGYDALCKADLIREFDSQPFQLLESIHIETLHLAHDRKGTTGYLLKTAAGRIGYATDLGHVPNELIERFTGVDVVAIESNYDPTMQLNSSRPAFLKKRIMGGRGHISNDEAFDAVKRIVDRSGDRSPQHVVLLHRSNQCNEPALVEQVFNQDPGIGRRVVLTHQRRRTKWIEVKRSKASRANQMRLGF